MTLPVIQAVHVRSAKGQLFDINVTEEAAGRFTVTMFPIAFNPPASPFATAREAFQAAFTAVNRGLTVEGDRLEKLAHCQSEDLVSADELKAMI